jgi:hypothetical protein
MATVTQTLYCIQATVNGRQVPTFYLDAQVQGILNARQAEKVARDILNSASAYGDIPAINIAAMEINYEIAPWGDAERINNV